MHFDLFTTSPEIGIPAGIYFQIVQEDAGLCRVPSSSLSVYYPEEKQRRSIARLRLKQHDYHLLPIVVAQITHPIKLPRKFTSLRLNRVGER
jgi:hypothetical protein